jgi:allantoinase
MRHVTPTPESTGLTRLRCRHTVTPLGVIDAVVSIAGGRIFEIAPVMLPPGDRRPLPDPAIEDLGDRWLLPGCVDTHVHINEPGRAEWEGFATATRAAAAGGITTLVDMPLNSVPATCSVAALQAKRDAAKSACAVDVAFWGGVVPGNAGELEALAQAGVRGFKCFLAPSGVEEFAHVGKGDLRRAMPVIARLGLPLLAHAEWPAALDRAAERLPGGDPRAYATWLALRPVEAECEAIEELIRLCADTGCAVHVVHVAAGPAIPLLRAARADGLPITAETCPHYLVFDADSIPDGATPFKCAPPIRHRSHREALWEGLRDGTLSLVATDHSPCPPVLKRSDTGDFLAAWGGIASLEVALAALWTEARGRGFTLAEVSRWTSAAPAKLAGLARHKGAIVPGHDADLIAFDPDAGWVVDAAALHQRHKVTPYAGRPLVGRVVATWVRGVAVYRDGAFLAAGAGRAILTPGT